MKTTLKILLTVVAALAAMHCLAYDFMVDELAYNINEDGASVEVTSFLNYSPFTNYPGLTEANIPETVTYNGITYSVTSIGDYAFDGCKDLLSVTIPNSVTIIDVGAFCDCTGLTSITIPNSVTSIGGDSFLSCTGLTSIIIPNSVISIGDYAFSGCTSLTSVTIPNSITAIGHQAFSVCIGLCSIHSEINEPQNVSYEDNIFLRVNTDNCKLIVPKGTLELYQSTAPWNLFLNIGEDSGSITPLNGDMNEDGIIDVEDVNALINIILKL